MKIKLSVLLCAAMIVMMSCGAGGEDPFAEAPAVAEGTIDVNDAFTIVAEINEKTRTLYTKNIVGLGKKAGIGFHEDWQQDEVEAGPLPALFLRGTSEDIQKSDVPLGLYLGSDYPVRRSNMLKGVQAEKFAQIREDSKPKFFYDEANELYTAMFPDFASAGPCVSCHNTHENTTKTDWALGDIMGATTWTYPKEKLTSGEVLAMINSYRNGVMATYDTFLDEVKAFEKNEIPEIGEHWSDKGYYVPSRQEFMKAVDEITAPEAMIKLLSTI